jgi:tRNA-2-methylthio-N6-dimethylallyladenosine synthase
LYRSLCPEQGYREVTLLGQNVNSYGKGLEEPCSFPELLRLVQDVDGIERIRFVTSHPRDLSDALIGAIRDFSKVCESVHLPVQSGADRVLASMNRRYTSAEYLDTVRRLRNAIPDMVITTDIIVGFPGETADDFARTMQLLQEVEYDNIFAFKYSQRPHTKALGLPGHLAEEVKEERLAQVLELQKGISLRKNEQHIGSVQEVLVEGASKKGGMLTGRTRGNKAVNFFGPAHLRGSFVDLRITTAGPNSLSGEVCE